MFFGHVNVHANSKDFQFNVNEEYYSFGGDEDTGEALLLRFFVGSGYFNAVADPEIICWGCGEGVQPYFQGIRSSFLPKIYTKFFFSRGAAAHPGQRVGPPML
ncbi:hypothetical protein HanRHA438_Chr15g0724161 [Helianthus annuus]|uniref:Uncharacterized protein n=1 Tax=Helianthus annuus TaxID=4232 RepID=A0A9K3E4V0_HELAN|nr:hypothetical protein HanXRQr2_Chr15g0711911 [Helianthus annuus]KAJ0452586.1 hypothetical protein HanHA300_Chr15g0580591 [Helianthus annuus]KAJ0457527.1 hypothetical protein HanIR_Chr15g0774701 [Helianthus annuus]KAJ0474494.1 hypothetical protein HanHA89_Chr15g0630311 [Helianthus annuus]KAJ0650050.1 hypothetical protein HanLR1_Chr15g0591221 [Helianthus annuus]